MNQNNSEETKKLNIAIVQAFDKNIREYAEYSRLINALYAFQKGYTYISFEDDLVPVHVSAYYNKILAIQRVFQDSRNFDWVFYLDSDAVITNFSYNIEDILGRHPQKEIIFPQDENGKCSGTILLKNTSKMLNFLQDVYTNKDFFHTETPEQSAMFYYLDQDTYKDFVSYEGSDFFGAYLNLYSGVQSVKFWGDDSFILHLFRLSTEDRCRMFRQILAKNNILCIVNSKRKSRLFTDPPKVGPDPQKDKN